MSVNVPCRELAKKEWHLSLSNATQNLETERWGWLWSLPKWKSQKPDLEGCSKRKMRWAGDMRSVSWPGTCTPALGTGEVPGLGTKSQMGRTGGFTLCALQRQGSGMRPWGHEGVEGEGQKWGCGISERAQWLSGCLKMGDCYLLRAWWQRGQSSPSCCGPLGFRASSCAKPRHLLLAGRQPPPTGIQVSAEAVGKTLSCQHPAEPSWGFRRLEKEDFWGQPVVPHFPASPLCAAPPRQHPCPPPASPLNINASGRLDNNVTGNWMKLVISSGLPWGI